MTAVGPDLTQWSGTPLGDPASWSVPLRTVAGVCLAYPVPCALFWGRRARFLYNETLGAGLGTRHPGALGLPLYDVLPETWPTFGPILQVTALTGRPSAQRHFPLPLDIGTGAKVRFVDYACVPVHDEGRVAGVLCPIVDSTDAYLRDRHQRAATRIALIPDRTEPGRVAEEVCRQVVALPGIRFAVLFRAGEGGVPDRTVTAGGLVRPRATRAAIDLAVAQGRWPVAELLRRGGPPVPAVGPPAPAAAPQPSWQTAWLAPLAGPNGPFGVLAVGLDERVGTSLGPADLVADLAAAAAVRLAR